MTKINEPIRQAAMYTMGGLPDPRLMPDYERKERRGQGTPANNGVEYKLLFRIYTFLFSLFNRKLSDTQREI
jgi:hypothetical protein